MARLTIPWKLVPADGGDILAWSFGQVSDQADLYEPRIFGPRTDLACECGKHRGPTSIGRICDVCGVYVSDDAVSTQRSRLGHIQLAVPCSHPYEPTVTMTVFPVCPIYYRMSRQGEVSALGQKYEELVAVNNGGSREPIADLANAARFAESSENLESMLRSIVGEQRLAQFRSNDDPEDTLVALARLAFEDLSPDFCWILRSCGLTLEISARL